MLIYKNCSLNIVSFHPQLFYTEFGISKILPLKRYANKHGAARVMECTIKEAHEKFLERYPEEKIGRTTFQKLRPRNCRLMCSVIEESSLCPYCTNIR